MTHNSTTQISRVVSAILMNERGEVLLQQRDSVEEKPNLPYAGYWTLFGGSVEPGEEPGDAIRRELHEELELETGLQFWKSYHCPARTIPGELVTINYVYIGRLKRDLQTLTLHEGQGMRCFSQSESTGLDLAFMQSPVLASFFEQQTTLFSKVSD
ncbi:MAG TPA: NUDIX domain-containing protein [Phototrophicaceae bacterium]|nr:NUDIX domain-containing protein [Phototrophicaceae bacterium]